MHSLGRAYSKLAVFETLLSAGALSAWSFYTGDYRIIAVWSLVGWALMLSTARSRARGLRWFVPVYLKYCALVEGFSLWRESFANRSASSRPAKTITAREAGSMKAAPPLGSNEKHQPSPSTRVKRLVPQSPITQKVSALWEMGETLGSFGEALFKVAVFPVGVLIFGALVALLAFLAAALAVVLTAALVLTATVVKFGATVLEVIVRPRASIRAIPKNWRLFALRVSSRRPFELVPGLRRAMLVVRRTAAQSLLPDLGTLHLFGRLPAGGRWQYPTLVLLGLVLVLTPLGLRSLEVHHPAQAVPGFITKLRPVDQELAATLKEAHARRPLLAAARCRDLVELSTPASWAAAGRCLERGHLGNPSFHAPDFWYVRMHRVMSLFGERGGVIGFLVDAVVARFVAGAFLVFAALYFTAAFFWLLIAMQTPLRIVVLWPAITYRICLKATAVVYSPLFWVVSAPYAPTGEPRNYLVKAREHPSAAIGRAFAKLTLAVVLLKWIFAVVFNAAAEQVSPYAVELRHIYPWELASLTGVLLTLSIWYAVRLGTTAMSLVGAEGREALRSLRTYVRIAETARRARNLISVYTTVCLVYTVVRIGLPPLSLPPVAWISGPWAKASSTQRTN